MVHGVPERAQPPQSPPEGPVGPRPVDGVLFDFHGTLAQVEDAVTWVLAAAASCGTELDRLRATALADRLVMAGRPGGPAPYRVPPHLADVYADRDLYGHCHRAAYTGLAATVPAPVDGLPEALYERMLLPQGWQPYADTAATLRELRSAGVPVAVVSNIGFDIRPHFAAWGLTDLVDAFVLSFEVGRCKPDPGIFLKACAAIGVDPQRALMVGDSTADAGAVQVGCATLVLPAAEVGRANGLAAAAALARPR